MTVRIVTDSTCDLPESLVVEHGITVIPLYINIGEQSWLDGVELTREEFYARLPELDPAPTTSVPSPQMFSDAYGALVEEGATGIVSIHISERLSGTANVARLAVDGTSSVPIAVVDSGTLSMGIGFLALAAARAAAAREPLDQIVASIKDQAERTHVFAALETLVFLQRSGRMNRFVSTLGGLLNLKPLLKMSDGSPNAERVRTTARATGRLIELLEERAPLEQVAIVHTHAPARADELRGLASHLLPETGVLSVDITPVFGVHLGPGAAGFACVAARRS